MEEPHRSGPEDSSEYSDSHQLATANTSVRRTRAGGLPKLAVVVGLVGVLCAAAIMWQTKDTRVVLGPEEAPSQLKEAPSQLYRDYEGELSMPDSSNEYDGAEDKRDVPVLQEDTVSIFVVGDWGATLPNHCTFPCDGTGIIQNRTAYANCVCFRPDSYGDEYIQLRVADQMKERAKWADPQYVINVGDNFYVQGVSTSCNEPPYGNWDDVGAEFQANWIDVYGSLTKVPWISVLGNHDYGGWRFDRGWPQQIGYSFRNHNWVLPARFYTKRIFHKNFYIDYIMFDTNAYDAADRNDDEHNICSTHNEDHFSCANNGGMTDPWSCHQWFWDSLYYQKWWVEEKIKESDARWKVIVTHFPCGWDATWYKDLKKNYGLDLLLTGHRHQQELWNVNTASGYVAAYMRTTNWDSSSPQCIVSGGGGGIVSEKHEEAPYNKEPELSEYGFYHLHINKDWINIELINEHGVRVGNATVYPHGTAAGDRTWKKPTQASTRGPCHWSCGLDSEKAWFPMVCEKGYVGCDGCDECVEWAKSNERVFYDGQVEHEFNKG